MYQNGTGPVSAKNSTDPASLVVAVTVTYNSADVIDDFLDSVASQGGRWSLVIVDNASTDGTRARLAQIADDRIHVILNAENDGFAAGTNIGIRRALQLEPASVLVLNNDTVFGAALFADLASELESSGADAISPVIVFDHDPTMIWYAGGHLDWRRGVKVIHEDFERPVDVVATTNFRTSFCPACCLLFTRSALERVGLFDEDFFVYWEDAEHCMRMEAAGMTIMIAPRLRVRHKASILTGGMMSDFSLTQQYKNRMIFLRKTASPLMLAYGVAIVTAAVTGRFLFKGDTRRGAARRLQAIRAGLSMPLSSRHSG